ncbi:hypothetical protein F5Y17DRAFT_417548 [Xylariaceae sp. FL0594]|nr:hypothetical protein F5Y17DRAFT_417548 [Xylariaceae sp. FL0594]
MHTAIERTYLPTYSPLLLAQVLTLTYLHTYTFQAKGPNGMVQRQPALSLTFFWIDDDDKVPKFIRTPLALFS